MFTGIITGVGQIVDSQPLGADASHGRRLTLQTPAGYLEGVGLGDSIAINGACMTVTTFDVAAGRFTIDVSAESLARTVGLDTLGTVNMEQALRTHDRLGGHLVTGHVDGVGDVVVFERKETARDGDTVIALVDDAEATLKIFRSQADGRIRLEPRNESLKPMVFDADRVRIQGTVVGVLRRYDRRS